MQLTTLLPVAVMGPVMGQDISGANHLVKAMLAGQMPALPNLFIPIVDVRDVAAAHLQAMTLRDAAGERFLIASGPVIAMKDIGATLRAELGDAAGRVPTRALPNIVVRLGALFSPQLRTIAPDLDYVKKLSGEKARRVLGWTPRDAREAIAAAAKSMVRKGLVKRSQTASSRGLVS